MSKSETHDRMIEAAFAVFSDKGYEAASTRAISEKADVNETTIFRHFGNKENLFREVLSSKTPISYLTDGLGKQLTGNVRTDLTHLANLYLETQFKNLDYIRISMMEVLRNSSYADLVHMIPSRLEEHLTKYLRDLGEKQVIPAANFGLLARMFYGQLFQYVMTICCFPDVSKKMKQESSEFIETLVHMFVRTINE